MEKRQVYYIKKEFQGKMIMEFCMLAIIGFIAFAEIIYLFSANSTTAAFENSRFVIKSTSEFILPLLVISLVFVVVAVGLATAYVVKHFSHSIAGPLFRFEKHLEHVENGDLSKVISLRTSDELRDLEDKFNSMTVGLKMKIKEIKRGVDELSRTEDVHPFVADQIESLAKKVEHFKVD